MSREHLLALDKISILAEHDDRLTIIIDEYFFRVRENFSA